MIGVEEVLVPDRVHSSKLAIKFYFIVDIMFTQSSSLHMLLHMYIFQHMDIC